MWLCGTCKFVQAGSYFKYGNNAIWRCYDFTHKWLQNEFLSHFIYLFTIILFPAHSVLESNLRHNQMFEELPVVLRNSHLVNALMCEIEGSNMPSPRLDLFNLSMKWVTVARCFRKCCCSQMMANYIPHVPMKVLIDSVVYENKFYKLQ